ncbi:MAG: 50S ribosomal protein L17 [bacterium]
MRHGDKVKKIGRKREHRRALLRNLVSSLIKYERIRTTVVKAKEAQRFAERLVSKACSGSLAARREVAKFISDKELVKKLFAEIAPRFTNRSGGYTRIYHLGNRPGDSAEMAYLEFVVRGTQDNFEGSKQKATAKKTGAKKKSSKEKGTR